MIVHARTREITPRKAFLLDRVRRIERLYELMKLGTKRLKVIDLHRGRLCLSTQNPEAPNKKVSALSARVLVKTSTYD